MTYTFTKSTDEEHIIKLESKLIYAMWKSGIAYGGTEAKFEVRTSFVGEGAQIKIACRGDDYGKIGKITDKIYNNRYSGKIKIPEDIKPGEELWLKVKLSKQKLKGTSNCISAFPSPIMTRMHWDRKEVHRDDIVKIQANFEQIADNTEVYIIIYEYDRDGNHDKITTIPTTIKNRKIELQWHYQYFEDTDEIPTEEELQKYGKNYNPPEYFFLVDIDGVRFGENQESGLLEFKDWIELELVDDQENPIGNTEYILHLSDGSIKEGKLNDKGYARIEGISPGGFLVKYPNAITDADNEDEDEDRDEDYID